MTTRADYTHDEWENVSNAFIMAAMGVSDADDGGAANTHIEFETFVQASLIEAKRHPDNELIQAVMHDKRTGDNPENKQMIDADLSIPDVIVHLQRTSEILAAKSNPTEAAEFKRWLLEVAVAVANAAGKGWFGGGREKVNPEELDMLSHIRTALGIGTN